MPGSLETITYQAQVLGKGSIHPELVQQQQQQPTPFGVGEPFSPSGAPTGSSKQGLATLSWSPSMRSPFKDALSKLSRISRAGASGGSASGLQSQPSDVLPKMAFLQKAAQSMRTEQQRHGAVKAAAAAGSSKPAAGAAAPTGLHTVVEVRDRSVDGDAAEAAAAAARASVAAAAAAGAAGTGTGAGSQLQQQLSVERPSSFELRATDMVLGNASLRKRVLAGQQDGEQDAESEGSPRAGGSGVQGFAARPAWPLAGAGQLAHSGLKRRSQNYS